MAVNHIYLIPGFFGFVDLGDLAYWGPAHDMLKHYLRQAAWPVTLHVVPVPPTASLRVRSRAVVQKIRETAPVDAPLHLIGHSSGGLDARLLVTPGLNLVEPALTQSIAQRVQTVITVATPHRGTPSAEFFSSLYGKRLLRLFSLSTVYVLRRGHLPLRVVIRLAQLMRRSISLLPGQRELSLDDHLFDALLGEFTKERRAAVKDFMGELRADQGLLSQITPHGMDIFGATAPDRPGVRYGCVITRARRPGARRIFRRGLSPLEHGMAALYASCWYLASTMSEEHLDPLSPEAMAALIAAYGEIPTLSDNDGMVPSLSQVHGEVIRAIKADHLDVLGHYPDPESFPPRYDWLTSGSEYRRRPFEATWEDVADFLLDRG
ncbi:MAG: triacylglycerol lipase [Deltaproteobacteria bacterium]|nr:MAG: triacylglycerol lipase [Deltaproteobacteria bacterium]